MRRFNRRPLVFALIAAAVLSAAISASAASFPRLSANQGELYLHPNEKGTVSFLLKNAAVKGKATFSTAKTKVAGGVTVKATEEGWDVTILAGEANGKTSLDAELTLPNGKLLKRSVEVHVSDNFAPRLNWSRVLINEETGYPQLKLSCSDDNGLSNVCFVRVWTDESGDELREIYDIITISSQKQSAACYLTLTRPGAYSVQINDVSTPTRRFDSKTLITLVDIDNDGVVDAYHTGDPTVLTLLFVDEQALPPMGKEINPA